MKEDIVKNLPLGTICKGTDTRKHNSNRNGFQVTIYKMSGSVTESSDLTYPSQGYQLPAASIQTESSRVQGINNEESTGESSKEQVSSFVGWTVYKKYGTHEVKGVVLSYNQDNKLYDVLYDDGKPEKVTEDSLVRYLSPCRPGHEQPRRSLRMNAQNAGCSRPARKAVKRKRAGTAAAQQSRQVPRGTAAAQPSRQVPRGSATAEMPTADSGNERKKPYRSLRMNPGKGRVL